MLLLGSSTGGTGSFALASVKNTMVGAATEAMLDGIVEAFQNDLIRHLYELNGMDATRMCKLDYENLHTPDLDNISKVFTTGWCCGSGPKDS